MEGIQLVEMFLSTAKKIYDVVEKVKYFKKRHCRIQKRIKMLMPLINNLARSQQNVPDSARTPEGLKLFSLPLGEILQLFNRIDEFLGSLDNKSWVHKFLFSGGIGRQFDEYSDELDSHIPVLQLSLTIENREVQNTCTIENREVQNTRNRRLEDDQADQENDENELRAGCKDAGHTERELSEVLEKVSKLTHGQEEILKKLENLKVSPTAAPGRKNQSTISKYHTVEAGMQQIEPDQLMKHQSPPQQGRFGLDYNAVYMHETVAVKSFSIRNNQKVKEILLREANNLIRLNTSYVVRLWGVYTKQDPCLLVFEYMAKGNLREVLDEHGADMKTLPWERRIQMAIDGALGLHRMHAMKPSPIMHQNLASNIFLVGDNWKVKISGVGFAETQTSIKEKSKPLAIPRETVNYISPERLKDFDYEAHASSDIYSYGIVMWEIATGERPYKGLSDSKIDEFVLKKKAKLPLPEACPCDFKTLIDECRSFNPKDRPSASVIIEKLQKLRASLEETWC